MTSRSPVAWSLLAVLLLGACGSGDLQTRVEELDTPAPPGSRFPSIVVRGERVYLSWIEAGDEPPRVRFAVASDGVWGPAETLASGPDLFVNWADFPSLSVDPEGTVGAQWLVRAGGPSWAYGIRFATRSGDAETWTDPAIPHGEDHAGEHGFVSMHAASEGAFELVWLDGRDMQDGGLMELRRSDWSGSAFGAEQVLDRDVCTCCQTDMVGFGDQRFVAYRDHAPGEIRDISYVRFDGRDWTPPAPLSHDGWQIAGCPVNGPAIGSHGNALAVAWFTQAHDQPRIWARRSEDFGRTFGEPIRIDADDPIGRVDVAMLDDGSYVIVWLERDGDEARVQLRRVADGATGEILSVGRTAAHRGSGFPRVATDGSDTWVAWTETTRPPRIRLSRVRW